MDHQEAMRIKAAERYVLGELGGELREQYEAHYFTCPECAKELRSAAAFATVARDVFSAETTAVRVASPREPRAGFLVFFPRPALAMAAIVLLTLVVGYQNFLVIPRLRTAVSQSGAPVALTSFSLIGVNSRGSAPVAISLTPGRPFSLFLDIPPQSQFPIYTCELEDAAAGATKFTLEVTAQQAKDTVQLLIPAGLLPAGNYEVIVRGFPNASSGGAGGTEVARYPFTLAYAK